MSVPLVIAICSSVGSLSRTSCVFVPVTNHSSVGTNQSEGILGSHPNIVYHICHAPRYSALNCPSCYTP